MLVSPQLYNSRCSPCEESLNCAVSLEFVMSFVCAKLTMQSCCVGGVSVQVCWCECTSVWV